jgi:hypothetical protein
MIETARLKRSGRRLARLLVDRLGMVGLAGIGLLLAAGVLGLSAPPLERQASDLRDSAGRARELLEQARRELERKPPPLERAARLREWFPSFEQSTADLRAVFAAAERRRIDIPKGDYALTTTPDAAGLQRFDVVLPVKDRYVTIKGFVADVLQALPHASLAELRIERSAAGVETLDARVRLSLFYRAS